MPHIYPGDYLSALDEIERLQAENAEHKSRLDNFEKCFVRARKMWQEAYPDYEGWPDGAVNIAWLMDTIFNKSKEIMRLQVALKEAEEDAERKQAVLTGTGFEFVEDENYGLCLRGHGTVYIPEVQLRTIRPKIEQDPPGETNDDEELPY
jgi:hypothetical protein